MNYYWPLCQRSNLNSFRINVLVLSGILVRSFSMYIYYCCIKISFNSNPESFQILADEIVNSSMTLLIRVCRSCSTSGTRRVNLVTTPVISR
jgi:hypothetical protein